ncbi:MAG: preprotein translocase subunit SecG [Rhodospirillaceae bacterium]|nr:preprotein translocase subunit SecG [Rhodospirillaceae bacterium]
MLTVLIVIHIMVAVGLIALILLQKSEGNAAGGGFSVSSVTAMMQPRARPNPLSRATTILGIGFFATSLGLAVIAKNVGPAPSLLNSNPATAAGRAPRVDEVATPAATAPAETAPEAAPAAPAVPTVPKN